MASTPGLQPEPDRADRPATRRSRRRRARARPSRPRRSSTARPQGLFPPGSTFKTITAAAALDDDVYTPDSTFDDPGYCTEYGKQITNALDQSGPRPTASSTSSRPTSTRSTPSSATSARSSAPERILDEAKKFGFYSVPPLETPADARSASGLYTNGKLFDPKTAAPVLARSTRAGSPSGRRRCSSTPLQMALVAAAVANNGVEMTPTLIKRIVSPGRLGRSPALHPQVLRQATTPEDRGRAAQHDGRGRAGRHRHRGADPGRRRRRQDRHRRDRARATTSTTPGSSSSRPPSTRSSPARSSSSTRSTASAARSPRRSPSS